MWSQQGNRFAHRGTWVRSFLAGAGSDAAGPRSCLTRPSGTHRGGLKVPAGGGILLPQEEPSLVQVRLARGIFRLRSERRTLAVGLPWLNVVLLDVVIESAKLTSPGSLARLRDTLRTQTPGNRLTEPCG